MKMLTLLLLLACTAAIADDDKPVLRADEHHWNTVAPTPDTREWDRMDKFLFGSFVVVNVIDAMQTVDMKNHPGYYEMNPLLGKHPSEGEVWLFKAAVVTATYYIVRNAHPANRKLGLAIANAIVLTAVEHNHSIGLRVRF